VTSSFNPLWNPHYDFNDLRNRAEIDGVEGYILDSDKDVYTPGQVVDSPWGSNQVVTISHKNGQDVCVKTITVKPGYMLSLQRHRGRAELWEVVEGELSVILNGQHHAVPAGQSISIPKGAVHCMINSSDAPVTVKETQTGICREKDNIRVGIDFNNRPTYPAISEEEFRSVKLYAQIQAEHVKRYGFGTMPNPVLLEKAQ